MVLSIMLLMVLSPPRPAAAASFEFWSSHSGAAARTIAQLCDGFNASQQQHHVQCLVPGSYEQTMQKTIAAYRAGQQPALVEIYDVATLNMMLSGAVLPVQPLMNAYGHALDWNDYLPAVRSYYADTSGQFDSLPFNISTAVLFVHRDALQRAGIRTLPATWEQLEQTARALHSAGATCPLVSDFNPWIMLEQFNSIAGVAIADQDNGHRGLATRYRFDRGPHLRFMQDVLRWRQQHLLVEAAATRTGRHTLAFTTGECAMLLDSTSAWHAIARSALKDVAVLPLPLYAGSTRYNSVPGGASLWVLKGFSPEVYAGVTAFIAYLQSPQSQMRLVMQTGYLPVTRAVAAHIMAHPDAYPAAVPAGIASLDTPAGQGSMPPRLGFFPQLRQAWTEQIQMAMADQQDVRTALTRACQRGDRLLLRFARTHASPAASSP